MTVVVTRNVSRRIRGFLASSMIELGPGVYSGSRINPKVRENIRNVLQNWFVAEDNASIVMVWEDHSIPGGQNVWVLGLPPIELLEVDGLVVSRRDINDSNHVL
jgi:CRISPR-associated protein Cas2